MSTILQAGRFVGTCANKSPFSNSPLNLFHPRTCSCTLMYERTLLSITQGSTLDCFYYSVRREEDKWKDLPAAIETLMRVV